MTLYLKYRPQTIDELDLESVRKNLKNIILSENVPHAFLFSGPKGTGKTSAARILAKIVNCENLAKDGEPCNKCASCISITKGNNIDILELDAASNRGIDDIRSLKEGISLAPISVKKKVYIIDEAHMLTLEAANAFLKTLEEPPDHVIFILATTNPEKLPETVISRLTRVDFTKAADTDIARQLERVTKGEKTKITKEAIQKIANLADGSFRDAVKILENLSFKTKDIKETDIEDFNFNNFFEILEKRNIKSVLEFIENLVQNGISIKNFSQSLIEDIHTSLLAKNAVGVDKLSNFSENDLIKLNDLLIDAKKQISPVSQLPIEIALIKFLSNNESKEVEKISQDEPKKVSVDNLEIKPSKAEVGKPLDDSTWLKLLQNIREKNVSIEALLRAARPLNFDGKNLNVGVYYQFHKEHLEDTKNTKILEDICKQTFGLDTLKIDFELIDKPISAKPSEVELEKKIEINLNTTVDKDIIDAAKEIFG